MGKQYASTQVSRNALDDHDETSEVDFEEGEDELAPKKGDLGTKGDGISQDGLGDEKKLGDADVDGDDSEIDSDEAFTSGDEERFKEYTFRGSRKTRTDNAPTSRSPGYLNGKARSDGLEENMEDLDMEDEEQSDLDSEYESDLEMEDDPDNDDFEAEDEDDTEATSDDAEDDHERPGVHSDRAALRALMSSDSKTVAASISAAATADAQKGRAVKEQYQTFDRLIDMRIKLQRGLTALNTLSTESADGADAVKKAEKAALQLWSTLESLRHDFLDAQDNANTVSKSRKRKRPMPATRDTSTSSLNSRVEGLEDISLPQRRAVLDKWSGKVRASTAIAEPRPRLLGGDTRSAGITGVIDAYLTTQSSKLVAEATSHTANSLNTPFTFEDSAFYQSLLRDLINSRSTTNQSSSNNLSATILPSMTRLPKKHRPNVDVKASKGRKIRYTVHEKLMNFTAPETLVGTRWGDQQKDEFFGSLFGGKKILDERDEDSDAEVNGGSDDRGGESVALRLFK